MRIKVLNQFCSQFNTKVIYEKDDLYDFPEARAKELIDGGFAEEAKEESEGDKGKKSDKKGS